MKYILIVFLAAAFFVNMTKGFSSPCDICTLDPSDSQDRSRGCAALRTYLQCLHNCGGTSISMEQSYKQACGTVALSVGLLTVLGSLLVSAYTNVDL